MGLKTAIPYQDWVWNCPHCGEKNMLLTGKQRRECVWGDCGRKVRIKMPKRAGATKYVMLDPRIVDLDPEAISQEIQKGLAFLANKAVEDFER